MLTKKILIIATFFLLHSVLVFAQSNPSPYAAQEEKFKKLKNQVNANNTSNVSSNKNKTNSNHQQNKKIKVTAVKKVSTSRKPASLTDSKPKSIAFYYINFSPFFGDGEIIVIATDGTIHLQRAGNPVRDMSRVLKGKANLSITKKMKELRSLQGAGQLQAITRKGLPDEVVIHFGFSDMKNRVHQFKIWEKDWSLQNEALRKMRDLAREVIANSKDYSLIHEEHFKPGELKVAPIPTFNPQQIKAIFK